MKMRKTIALLSTLVLAFGMASCTGGDNQSTAGTDTTTGSGAVTEATASTTKVELEGYSVSLPSGWVSIPSSDKKSVKVYKTDDVNKIFGVNEIDITYKAKAKYSLVTAAFDSFEEVKDLKLGSYTWNGAKGPYGGGKELMSLNTTVGEGYISADIWIKVGDSTISVDDADVKAIIEGITVAGADAESTTAAETSTETTPPTTSAVTTTTTTVAETTTTTVTTTTLAAVSTTLTTPTPAATTSEFWGTIINHFPVPGKHDFTLPADCSYDFDSISFHAKNYFAQQTGKAVMYAEAEKLDGNMLTIHLYDIENSRALDYQYYYVDYHNLKGVDIDGNPVDLQSAESSIWYVGPALNSVDFGDAWGAALYLGDLNFDEDFNKTSVHRLMDQSWNAEYLKKYTFLKDIPENNYIHPVGGAKGGSQIWMLVPRPTNVGTRVMVKNIDYNTGNPLGIVCNQANGNPIILACNASGPSDCEVTFISDGDGVQRTFVPYVTLDTCKPACSESFIKILN